MTADKPEGARLRECPFCGNAATVPPEIFVSGRQSSCVYIGCDKCDVGFGFAEPDEVATQWNTRHETSILRWAEQNPEAMRALLAGHADVMSAPMRTRSSNQNYEGNGLSNIAEPRRLDTPYKPIEESKS